MIIHCCQNRGWNQKQKHKKTALEQRGMLRIWRRDCALCVIGNVFPCRQPHNHSATLLRGHSTLLQGCFFMFLFLIPFTIRQQYIIYATRNFPLSPCNSSNSVFFERIKKTATTFRGNSRCYFLCFLNITRN